MSSADFYIIATALLIAASCSLVGAFLILRKMAMFGDAISHAVLPGIVVAFLIGGRGSLTMLLGAAVVGVLCTLLIELLHKKARLQEDASIGISFTWLFALGIILTNIYTANIDLDLDCVLYGEIAYVPLDLWTLADGSSLGPRSLWISGAVFLFVLLYIWRAYKGLLITTFNPEFALAIGISASFWHFSFMGLVSLVTVFSFESVGAILVVALMIAPPATAYLLSQGLRQMLLLSLLFAALTAIAGYGLAALLDGSIAGAMASVSGVFFALAFTYQRLSKGRIPAPALKFSKRHDL